MGRWKRNLDWILLLPITAVAMPLLMRSFTRYPDVQMHGIRLGMTRQEVAAITGPQQSLSSDTLYKDFIREGASSHNDGFIAVQFSGERVVALDSDRVSVGGVEVREGMPLTEVVRRLGKSVPDEQEHIDSRWLCYDLVPGTRLAIQYDTSASVENVIHVQWQPHPSRAINHRY